METGEHNLKLVASRSGEPLYETVSRAILRAVDQGVFLPGKQMPTTEELSRELSVSLVTTHRALQSLVADGVLQRIRGKGTFVNENHRNLRPRIQIGVMSHAESSMGDYYHGRLLDGMRQAAIEHRASLVLMDYQQEFIPGTAGYLLMNPDAAELDRLMETVTGPPPVLIVGARAQRTDVPSIDTDNLRLAAHAVQHLHKLGHRRIGFVGGGSHLDDSRDRQAGFVQACEALKLPFRDRPVLDVPGYRLQADEKIKLTQMITQHNLTAVFAGGYYLALDVYDAAATLGLDVPNDLSVVGVDDPSSASRLHPPLTTLSQPLVHVGHAAVAAIRRAHDNPDEAITSESMQADLVVRESSGTPGR